jgi:alkylhydroperoxidase/carboxymuconolactone decarboxylase family protein YurZ
MVDPASPRDVFQRLAAVQAKRGYLLPHHGLLALTAPRLLDSYDATYTALTLERRSLSEFAREFVWLAILVATAGGVATHHIKKFRDAGGTDDQLEAASRLAAWAFAAPSFAFVAGQWKRHLPAFDRERAYRAGLDALVAGRGVDPGLVEMAMAAAQTCRRGWWELGVHIRGAYAVGVPEVDLAEALSITMYPGSVPNFVEACAVWRDVIRRGEVQASEPFRLWAAATDQGGFDQTIGS